MNLIIYCHVALMEDATRWWEHHVELCPCGCFFDRNIFYNQTLTDSWFWNPSLYDIVCFGMFSDKSCSHWSTSAFTTNILCRAAKHVTYKSIQMRNKCHSRWLGRWTNKKKKKGRANAPPRAKCNARVEMTGSANGLLMGSVEERGRGFQPGAGNFKELKTHKELSTIISDSCVSLVMSWILLISERTCISVLWCWNLSGRSNALYKMVSRNTAFTLLLNSRKSKLITIRV